MDNITYTTIDWQDKISELEYVIYFSLKIPMNMSTPSQV